MEAVFSDATVFLFRDVSANELQVVRRNLWEQQCCKRLNLYIRRCSCALYKAMFRAFFSRFKLLKKPPEKKDLLQNFTTTRENIAVTRK